MKIHSFNSRFYMIAHGQCFVKNHSEIFYFGRRFYEAVSDSNVNVIYVGISAIIVIRRPNEEFGFIMI